MNGLFIGLNTVDIQYLVNEYPGPNTKNLAGLGAIHTGGPATNAAITFSGLGGRSSLMTSVGSHFLSQFVINELNEYKIRLLDFKNNCNTRPVISSIITSGKNGDRTVFTFEPGEEAEFETGGLIRYAEKQEEMLDNIDIILTDGFYFEMAVHMARTAKEKSIIIVLDGGSWKKGMEKLIGLADIVICSQDFYPPGAKNTDDVFEYLSLNNCGMVAVTRGEKDILYMDQYGTGSLRVEKTKAVDTLGAGDILHGAFCYFYLKYKNFIRALKSASEIATSSCRYIGTREWMRELT